VTQRFNVTDVEVWRGGTAVVGVNFWDGNSLTDSPDLWFDNEDNARRFFVEASSRGWTSPSGMFMERNAAAKLIRDLARCMGGDWWSGGPFWFDRGPDNP